MEEKELTFIEKVIYVQKNLKAPKGQYNSYGKYRYRSAEDILNSVKPLLADKGLMLTIDDDILQLGNRFYVKATAILTDGHEKIINRGFAREDEVRKGYDGAQMTGAASSYARKYALNGLLCIDDTKDHDATNDGTSNTDKERIALALQEINSAQSRATLTEIWNNYADLQSNVKFSNAIAKASQKYPRQ